MNTDLSRGLVDVATLHAHLDDPQWRVFDCRFDLADPGAGECRYVEAHIPGARHAHLDHHLSSPITPCSGRHPLPDMDALCRWLGEQGVTPETRVVAYDDSLQMFSTRLWWLLRQLGHEQVAVLDGGWSGWLAAGAPVDRAPPRTAPRPPYPGRFNTASVVGSDTVLSNLENPRYLLIDVRAAERYRGEIEPIDPVAGHIPGAINRPLDGNLDAAGRFLPPEAIRARYASLFASWPAGRQVYMCGSGVSACQPLLALHQAGLGIPKLYAGSWSEWIRDPTRPVATGA
jgi:thiosulfate/3-mercaptopyruvate sulfurtransferase